MKRILVADDDPGMVAYYQALLTEAGYEVAVAADATSVLILYRELRPDLLVLDVEMPGGGGERAFEITRDIICSGVPVIFVTGSPERAAKLARAYAKVRVFSKPAPSEALLACVAYLLDDSTVF